MMKAIYSIQTGLYRRGLFNQRDGFNNCVVRGFIINKRMII